MIFNLVWAVTIWGLVFWGTKALGVSVPCQMHLAVALFLLGPTIARILRPEPKTRRRRRQRLYSIANHQPEARAEVPCAWSMGHLKNRILENTNGKWTLSKAE